MFNFIFLVTGTSACECLKSSIFRQNLIDFSILCITLFSLYQFFYSNFYVCRMPDLIRNHAATFSAFTAYQCFFSSCCFIFLQEYNRATNRIYDFFLLILAKCNVVSFTINSVTKSYTYPPLVKSKSVEKQSPGVVLTKRFS